MERGGWREAAPQRRQQRPTARRSRETGARRGGLSASSASICKPRDAEEGEKLYGKRSEAQIAAGEDKRPQMPGGSDRPSLRGGRARRSWRDWSEVPGAGEAGEG